MGNHNCHMNNDGTLKCWGYNNDGQLGYGDRASRGNSINQMGSDLPIISLGTGLVVDSYSIGGSHTCAHFASNVVKCWGKNSNGQLGLGDQARKGDGPGEMGDNLPISNLGTVSAPSKVYCGDSHTCVLFANKKVKCFGNNDYGQIGIEGFSTIGGSSNEVGDNLPFVNIGTGINADTLAVSNVGNHNCIVISGSQLMKCWGYGEWGQLGYNETINRGYDADTMGDNLPIIDLGNEDKVKQITLLGASTCALRIDEELKCWGLNEFGQLGIGSALNSVIEMGDTLVSTPYDSAKKIKQIQGGFEFFCILFDDNLTVKCIGDNQKGQLGLEDTANRGNILPTTMPNNPIINLGTGTLQISKLQLLPHSTCVIFVDNRLKCFGAGGGGELGSGAGDNIGDTAGEMGSSLQFVDVFKSLAPTNAPTYNPTISAIQPSKGPTKNPVTLTPTKNPVTGAPSKNPTLKPSNSPSRSPSKNPTTTPTNTPTTATPTTKAPTTKTPTTAAPTSSAMHGKTSFAFSIMILIQLVVLTVLG